MEGLECNYVFKYLSSVDGKHCLFFFSCRQSLSRSFLSSVASLAVSHSFHVRSRHVRVRFRINAYFNYHYISQELQFERCRNLFGAPSTSGIFGFCFLDVGFCTLRLYDTGALICLYLLLICGILIWVYFYAFEIMV